MSSAVLVWRHFTWTLDTQDGSCDMRHRTCRNISSTQRCATTRPKLSPSSSRSRVTAVSALWRSTIDRRLEDLTLALPPPGPVIRLLLQLLPDEEMVDEVGVGVAAQQPAGVGPRQLAPLHLDTRGYWAHWCTGKLGNCDGATHLVDIADGEGGEGEVSQRGRGISYRSQGSLLSIVSTAHIFTSCC